MIPRTLSASSVQVAEGCLARFAAENINRSGRTSNDAALLGTTVHGALEHYVQTCHIDKTQPDSKELLLTFYKVEAIQLWGSTEFEMYEEGAEMLRGWYDRTIPTLQTRTVMSVEEKLTFPLKTSIGIIPFTYIMDRLDQTGPNRYEIVDYKTIRWGFNPEDLKKKMQARVYALALSTLLKSRGIDNRTTETWVRFDLLRHNSIATVFSHQENLATYKRLQEIAERIIAAPDVDPPRTLNSECNFCSIKGTCPELTSNALHGGTLGLDLGPLIDRRAQLEYQRKAVMAAITEMDDIILTKAKEEDELEFLSDSNRMSIAVSMRQGVDADMVEMVVGPELFQQYGGKSLTMEQFKKLQKNPAITADPAKVTMLKSLIQKKIGEPRVKIEPRGFVDDEA